MSATCFVCEEYFKRDTNPPMTLLPCGHITCNPCIITWRKENNSCPQCRKPIQKTIINRGLIDLIEENKMNKINKQSNNNSQTQNIINKAVKALNNPHHNTTSYGYSHNKLNSKTLFKKPLTSKDKSKEIIKDKCESVIYIIDNSKSMEYYSDGKIFTKNGNNKIIKKNGVLRWHEACSKIKKIAKYNISRKICASYYLLNPVKGISKNKTSWHKYMSFNMGSQCDVSDWQENIDFIVIDAQNEDDIMVTQKYNILVDNMLCEENVRGDTPLDVITKYFGRNLYRFIDNERYKNKAICYNIITDGEPNNKNDFEKELKYLANNYNIFLTINLCTEDDNIVEYYNELDTKIGKELSGMDVIDDLESEGKEIISAGNRFFVYTENIHICRMAGCYSIIADLMDERLLSVYHACKLCNELCGIQTSDHDVPGFNDRENYIKYIRTKVNMKAKVYDFGRKGFKQIIDVDKLDYMIWYNEQTDNIFEYVQKRVVYFIYNYPIICAIIVLFVLWMIK